eukprot:Opistho-2@90753
MCARRGRAFARVDVSLLSAALAVTLLCLCGLAPTASTEPLKYKIGSILSLTGQLSDASREQRGSLRAGIAYINAMNILPFNASFDLAGPIDDALDRATSLEASIELRNARVLSVVGPNTSPNAIISHLIFKKYHTPQCSIATSPTLSDTNEFPFFFRTQPSDAHASPMLIQLCNQMRWRKIGILSTNDDYATAFARSLYTEALASTIQVTMTDSATRAVNGVINFDAQLQSLLREKVRIIFIFAYNGDAFVAYDRARELGLVGPGFVWISEHTKYLMNDMISTAAPNAIPFYRRLFTGMIFFTTHPGTGAAYDEFVQFFAANRAKELNVTMTRRSLEMDAGVYGEPTGTDDTIVDDVFGADGIDASVVGVSARAASALLNPVLLPKVLQSPYVFDCVLSIAQSMRVGMLLLNESGMDVAAMGANLTGMTPINITSAHAATVIAALGVNNATLGNAAISRLASASTYGELLMIIIWNIRFLGASGPVQYYSNGDRWPRYALWNFVEGTNVLVGRYERSTGLILEGSPIVFNGGLTSNPGDGIEGSSLSTGAIVGIVLGSVGFVVVVVLLAFASTIVRRANRRAKEQERLRKLEEERRRDALIQTKIAKEGDKTKSLFLANMSHEIRSPLNGILGIAQLLEDEAGSASQKESLSTIRRCGESLLLILNDILDFSKLEANLMVVKREPFDPISVIEDVVALHGELAFRKGLNISFHACCACASCAIGAPMGDSRCILNPGALGALGEGGRFTQVLSNLVSNAIKFTDSGHVTVCTSLIGAHDEEAPSTCHVSQPSAGWPSHVVNADSLIMRKTSAVQRPVAFPPSLQSFENNSEHGNTHDIELIDVRVDPEKGRGGGERPHSNGTGYAAGNGAPYSSTSPSASPPSTQGKGALLLFEVHDTGIGLTEDELPRLFSRFHQGDNSLTKKYQGTGLGLAISASLINLMGGSIGVRSAPGKGSVFWCTLPVCESTAWTQKGPGAYFSHAHKSIPIPRVASGLIDSRGDGEGPCIDVVTLYSGDVAFVACARTCCRLLGFPCRATSIMAPALLSAAPLNATASTNSTGPLRPIIADLDWHVGAGGSVTDANARPADKALSATRLVSWFGSPRRSNAVVGMHRKPLTRAKVKAAIWQEEPEAPPAASGGEGTDPGNDATGCTPSDGAYAVSSATAGDGVIAQGGEARADAHVASVLSLPDMHKSTTTTVKVLVAEDNPINQKVALRIVKNTGYDAVGVEDGRQAVDTYLASPLTVGLILMDLQMPNVNGIDATREIRSAEAQRGLPRVPIYALTASAIGNIERECLANGMDGFVSKPFRKLELEATIRSVCDASQKALATTVTIT